MEHALSLFVRSIFADNMIFAYFLGMCSYLAVSKDVKTSAGLGVAVTFVLTITLPLNYLLQVYVLNPLNLGYLSFILFIAVIAAITQLVEMIVEKYSPSLYAALGIFLPLIVVNCIILGRAEMFASKNNVIDSALDGLGMGLGFTLALFCMATVREILGSGTWCGITLTANLFDPIAIMKLTPGGFLVYGVLIAIMNKFAKHKPKKKLDCAACGACAGCAGGCPSAENKEGGCEA